MGVEMNDVEVAIVGAGPTGLALAGELALAGVTCQILERRTDEPNVTRAFAVHARTLELLDARGLADQLVKRGLQVSRVQPVPDSYLDLSAVDSRYPMVLIVPQSGTERLLEERARELGVQIARGADVVGLEQDTDGRAQPEPVFGGGEHAPSSSGVRLEVAGAAGPRTVRARYAVAADGAHSTLRRLLNVDFVGEQYQTHIMLADVVLAKPPKDVLFGRNNADGLVLVVPFGDGWVRLIVWDRTREQVPIEEPVTLEELRDAFHRIAGDDFGMGEPRWRSRFLSERRQARSYRVGRVFLAGDAAHVHSPIGGQGMNTGIQDAFNLGWKLAAELRGWAAPGLLDSYQDERHPVGASVLALTDALNKLVLSSSRVGAAVRAVAIRAALRIGPARHRIADRITGLGIAYPAPAGAHAWVGRRMPDVEANGGRLYELLRPGRFALVDRAGGDAPAASGHPATAASDPPAGRDPTTAGDPAAVGGGPTTAGDSTTGGRGSTAVGADPLSVGKGWPDRVVPVQAAADAAIPATVLVRPDGYVAWAADQRTGTADVEAALRRWCGPPRTS